MMTERVRRNKCVITEPTNLENFLKENCIFLKNVDYNYLVESGRLELNGNVVDRLDITLQTGDVLILLTPENLEPKVNKNYKILFEDDYLMVIDKPANLPIHPAGKYYFNTLVELLKTDLSITEIYPVNRIDRETSGLIILAKTKNVVSKMQKLFSEGKVKKEYMTIVFGKFKEDEFIIDKKLKKTQKGEIRDHMIVTAEEDGLDSRTQIKRIRNFKKMFKGEIEEFSLLKINLLTGRRHQIRTHLASCGYPIVGDKQYGKQTEIFLRFSKNPASVSKEELVGNLGAERQLLHCQSLRFIHPETKEDVFLTTDLPEDFEDFLD